MKKVFFVLILLMTCASPALARIGVGVGTGKIIVDQELKPGQSYELPPFNVLNTGDEASDYRVGISYHEKQEELRPQEDWFSFSPAEFHLEPDGIQTVEVRLNLPVRVDPGKYFAFLEAQPAATSEKDGTTIGVAAASKLYFTVTPANMVLGVYYKAASLWDKYYPWTYIVSVVIVAAVISKLAKKYIHINISLQKKQREEENVEDE